MTDPEKRPERNAWHDRGETIAGTTEDDYGDIITEILPSGVDSDELTKTERAILNKAAQLRTATQARIATLVGVNDATVSRTLGRYYPTHPSVGSGTGPPKPIPERVRAALPERSNPNRLTELRIDILTAAVDRPDATHNDLSRILDCGESTVTNTLLAYPVNRDEAENEARTSASSVSDSTTTDRCEADEESLEDRTEKAITALQTLTLVSDEKTARALTHIIDILSDEERNGGAR